jgi:hypothetical protein
MEKQMIRYFIVINILLASLWAKGGVDIGALMKPHFSSEVKVTKEQFKLSPTQVKAIQKSAKAKLESPLIRLYRAKKGSSVEGYGVILVQTVRTKKAALLYIIDTQEQIKAIEIVAFMEPSEYKPKKSWVEVFEGKTLHDNLFAGKGIPTISGATLSAKAISDASRLALAIVQKHK